MTLHCVCIPFRGICDWLYEKCLKFLLKADQLRIRQMILGCCSHKCNHMTVMKHSKGQNKLFKNASLLMCFCNFATEHFLTLKTQSVRHVTELMF